MNYQLEAFHAKQNVNWLKSLPVDRPVTLGRLGHDHPDPNQPLTNRSDWVIPFVGDKAVSGRHAFLEVLDGRVRVRRNADKPTHPIIYRESKQDEFELAPGETFYIGEHAFTLRMPDSSEPRYQASLPVADLEDRSFREAAQFLNAIEKIASLELNDERYVSKFLKMLGQVFGAYAGRTAIVKLRDKYDDVSDAVVEVWSQSPERQKLIPSRRLMQEASRAARNAVRARFRSLEGSSFAETIDWAACVSVPQLEREERWGVYADGLLPSGVDAETFEHEELEEISKLLSVAARLLGNRNHCDYFRQRSERLKPFVPSKVRQILAGPTDPDTFRAAPLPITSLIGDIRGSAIIDTNNTSTALLSAQKQLEGVLATITSAIADTGGIVGGLQGDAAMGFWGWPKADGEASIPNAIAALARIRREFEDVSHPLWGKGQPGHGVRYGLGLAHGMALAGIMGVKEFRRVDLFGPVVNLAARLESLTKLLGVQIAVNEPIAEYVNSHRNTAEVIAMGKYRLPGMEQAIPVYELLPLGLTPEVATQDRVRDWEDLLERIFDEANWPSAREDLDDFVGHHHFGTLARALQDRLKLNNWKAPPGWPNFFDVDKAGHLGA